MSFRNALALLLELISLGLFVVALGLEIRNRAKTVRRSRCGGAVVVLGVITCVIALSQLFLIRQSVPVNEVTTRSYALHRFTFPDTEFVVDEERQTTDDALEVSFSDPEIYVENNMLLAELPEDGSIPIRTITLAGSNALQRYADTANGGVVATFASSVPFVLLNDSVTEQGYFYLRDDDIVELILANEDGPKHVWIDTSRVEVEFCDDVASLQQARLEEVICVTARDEGAVFGIPIASNEQIEIKYLIHLPSEYIDANAADYYLNYLFPETLARDLLETA